MAAVAPQPRISGEGTPERDWQGWDGLRRVPRIYLRQVVPGAGRLVVVAPHPDDEVLAAGGLIAMLAQRSRPAWIVAVTDGSASHPGSVRWTPDQLARIRQRESAIGLRVLGLNEDSVLRLRIPDGQVGSHTATLVAALQALLLPADVVVSTWSGDGHPDHEATAVAAAEACASVRCTHLQAPVWMWHWASPGDQRVPWGSLRRI
ncbi:MAG: PIG-L family deacetylase, partial [Betaproteobacteria bacterium]